jgi:hypothetical protein
VDPWPAQFGYHRSRISCRGISVYVRSTKNKGDAPYLIVNENGSGEAVGKIIQRNGIQKVIGVEMTRVGPSVELFSNVDQER